MLLACILDSTTTKDQCLNTHKRVSLVDSKCRGFQAPGDKLPRGHRGSQDRPGRREPGANRLPRWSSNVQRGERPQVVRKEMGGRCPNNSYAGWSRGRPGMSKPRGSSPHQSSSLAGGEEAGGQGAPEWEAAPS